jgi:hypothetical protein
VTGEDSVFACLALALLGALLTLALVRQRDLLAQPAPAR